MLTGELLDLDNGMLQSLSDDLERVASDMSPGGPMQMRMQQMQGPMQQMQGPNCDATETRDGSRRIGPYTVTGWNASLDQGADGTWRAKVPNTRTMGGYHRAEFNTKREAEAWMKTKGHSSH